MERALAALHAEHPRDRVFRATRQAAPLSMPDVEPLSARA
jgi:hypothetical protein